MNQRYAVMLATVLILGTIFVNINKTEGYSSRENTKNQNVINITDAVLIDRDRMPLENIYNAVVLQDNIWSHEVKDGEYARVTFETNLTNGRDITIWPRITSGNPSIEVYEKEGIELITEFESLAENEYNKVFLTGLRNSQDTFDLRVVGGGVEFDHIVDPMEIVFFDDFESDLTKWNGNGATAWDLSNSQAHDGTQSVLASNGNEGNIITDDIDTSGVTSVNVSFWFRDDDLDSNDIDLYFFDGSAYDLVIESLESGTEDTWQFVSFNTSDSQYFKSNFRVRFNAVLGSGENFWIDDFNVTITLADTTPPQVTINEPQNSTLNPPILFNVTTNENAAFANFTLTNGAVNYTMQNNGNRDFNATNVSIADGQYTVRYFVWDTSGNLNDTMNRTFTVFNQFNSYSVNISDSLRLDNSHSSNRGLFKTSSQQISLNASNNKFGGFLKTNSQTLGLNGSSSRFGGLFRTNSQQFSVGNIANRIAGLFRLNLDSVNVDDSKSAFRGIFRSHNQRLTIDGFTVRLASLFKANSQTFRFSDGFVKFFGTSKTTPQQVTFDDTVTRLGLLLRGSISILDLNDSVLRILGIFRGNTDALDVSDYASSVTSRVRISAQQITLGNAVNRMGAIFRIQTQQLAVYNVVERIGGIARYLIELGQRLNIENKTNRNSYLFKGLSDLMQFFSNLFSGKTAASSTGGGTGGGAGGGGGSGSTLTPSNSIGKLTKGITKEIGLNSAISFTLGRGQSHSMSLVGVTESTATIIIESPPQTVVLTFGREQAFDFNHDDLEDLSVKLISINSVKNNAVIEIAPLDGASRLASILFDPQKIKVSLKQGETTNKELRIENTGDKDVNLKLEVVELQDYVKLSDVQIELKKGMSKTINVDFLIREDTKPDLYLGKIVAEAQGIEEEILLAIDASSKSALFDIKLDIFKGKLIRSGDKIVANIQMLNFGDDGKIDAHVYYSIKNFQNGRVYELGEETLAIETQVNFVREFDTPSNLGSGIYLLTVRAVYPVGLTQVGESVVTGAAIQDEIVNSSAWFTVINSYSALVYLIIILLIVTILIIATIHLKRNGFFFSHNPYSSFGASKWKRLLDKQKENKGIEFYN